jgi:hypothetical protein
VTSAEQWTWRVGTHYNIHVYAVHPGDNRDLDVPVGTLLTPELAAEVVYAHNRLLPRTRASRPGTEETDDVEPLPQWEHLPQCIDDDCEGCAPQRV